MRGRGISWAATGALNSMTNGYSTPNNRVPDLVTHFTGFFGPRSWHTGGAHVVFGDGGVRFLPDGVDSKVHGTCIAATAVKSSVSISKVKNGCMSERMESLSSQRQAFRIARDPPRIP